MDLKSSALSLANAHSSLRYQDRNFCNRFPLSLSSKKDETVDLCNEEIAHEDSSSRLNNLLNGVYASFVFQGVLIVPCLHSSTMVCLSNQDENTVFVCLD